MYDRLYRRAANTCASLHLSTRAFLFVGGRELPIVNDIQTCFHELGHYFSFSPSHREMLLHGDDGNLDLAGFIRLQSKQASLENECHARFVQMRFNKRLGLPYNSMRDLIFTKERHIYNRMWLMRRQGNTAEAAFEEAWSHFTGVG